MKKILNAAKGRECVRCGRDDGTIVACHYSGLYAHQLGKGIGKKSHDHCVAFLCSECHSILDNYKTGNDAERAADFMLQILKTLAILFDERIIK